MRKIFTLFAAMLAALTVSATTPSTDFVGGYQFTATAASTDGYIVKTTHKIDEETTDEYLRYYDKSPCGTAEWEITCIEECYVTVTLNMYDNSWNYDAGDDDRKLFKNGGHKFQVQIKDGTTVLDSIAEPEESEVYSNITLGGELYVPAGTHKIKLLNNRAWSKCGISSITFTKVAIPSTNFDGGYEFTAADATISGNSVKCYHYTNPYIRYNDNAKPGIATWRIYASRACFVNVSMYMVDNRWNTDSAAYYKNSGHRFVVELLNSKNQPIDSVREASESTAPGTFPGSFNMPDYLIIPSAGFYTIRLLNPRAHSKCGIEKVTFTYTSDIPTVKSHGSWDYDNDAIFDLAEDGQSASTTLNLAQSNTNYSFKMVIGEEWRANGHNYNREYTSASGITSNGDDMSIYVNYTGEHKLTWYFKENKFEITFPVIPDPVFYVAGTFTDWENNKVAMTEEAGICTASIPLAANTDTYAYKILKIDAWGTKTWYGAENEGARMTFGNSTNWQLTTTGGGQNINLTSTLEGDYPFIFNAADAHMSVTIPDPSATAIDNTVVSEKAVKVLRNGQLFIEKGGKTYNVLGTVVK